MSSHFKDRYSHTIVAENQGLLFQLQALVPSSFSEGTEICATLQRAPSHSRLVFPQTPPLQQVYFQTLAHKLSGQKAVFWFTEHTADAQIRCSNPLKGGGCLSWCINLTCLSPFLSARKGGVGPVPENSPAGPVNALKELKKLENNYMDKRVFSVLSKRIKSWQLIKHQLRKPNDSKAFAISSSITCSQCFFPSKYPGRPFH